MKLFDKQSLALLVSVVTINVLCIIAVSYAYFTTQIKGNDTAGPITVVMGSMKIKYEDSDLVTLDNAIPGDYLTNKFRITNTGTLDATYNLKIDVVENNFRDKGDLEYTLRRNGEPVVENETLPYTDGYILVNQTITTGGVDNYELEVKFKVDETDKNQNDNKNRRVDFKIVVDSNEDAQEYVYKPLYKDNSGANIPELYQGLIPIYYNESNQIVIADVTQKWYDYDSHEWANAVLIDHTNKDIVNKFYNEDGTLKDGGIVTTDDILQMYVWIPRYKYQLFNANNEGVPKQIINIAFETGEDNTGTVSCNIANNGVETCTNASNGEWYTHPAFTFGDTELGGIWVGKFEPSDPKDANGRQVNEINEITILPDKTSMTYKNITTAFNAERAVETNSKYNLNSTEIDTHMAKNIEWGAVAYLTQSIYGIYKDENTCNIAGMIKDNCEVWINNTAQGTGIGGTWPYGGTYTGCVGDSVIAAVKWNTEENTVAKCDEDKRWNTANGVKASTTGNMYGLYDTVGGTWEYVMALIMNKEGTELYYNTDVSGVDNSNMPNVKYYDIYTFSDSELTYERGHLGDATRETLANFGKNPGGWNGDLTDFPYVITSAVWPWFLRGGYYSDGAWVGVFSIGRANGGAPSIYSFRSVLTAQDGVD